MTALISDRSDETEGFIARANTGNVGKSGDKLADGVLSGYEWKGATLTYAFPDAPDDYRYGPEKNNGFAPVNTQITDASRRILDQSSDAAADDSFSLEGFTNLNIEEGPSDRTADIRYAESRSANPTAYAYYPTGGQISGDVWFGKNPIYDTPVVGNYAFATILHETGHALGLKHGHQATSFDKIKTELHGRYDSLEYSVMTYHSYAGVKKNFYTNEEFGFPQTYMMADIRALQHMYGADYGANAGNTEYRWNPSNGNTLVNDSIGIQPGANKIFATIWDGNGVDTYNLSSYFTRVVIDLRPGQYSNFGASQRVDLGAFDGNPGQHLARGNIYNALLARDGNGDINLSSLIENAIGGAGNDKLTGNGANNVLTGNGGIDTFVFRENSNADTITDFVHGVDKINLISFDVKNFNVLSNKMSEIGGDVVINLGGGDTLTLTTHIIANLDKNDFIL